MEEEWEDAEEEVEDVEAEADAQGTITNHPFTHRTPNSSPASGLMDARDVVYVFTW